MNIFDTEPVEYALKRNGAPPLVFKGWLCGCGWGERVVRSSRNDQAGCHHDLMIYRTVNGSVVIEIKYTTTMRNEWNWSDAVSSATDDAALLHIRYYNPCDRLFFPPIDDRMPNAGVKKQRDANVRRAVQMQWGHVVQNATTLAGIYERA